MSCCRQIIYGILVILLTTACAFQEPRGLAPSQSGSVITPSAVASLQDASPLLIVTSTPMLPLALEAATGTPAASASSTIGNEGWETLVAPIGVAIDYPRDWEFQEAPWQQPFDWFGFLAPGEEGQPPETRTQIRFEVYTLPLASRETAKPQSWMPNEGGYEAHWLTPIQIEGAEGWLFVWGASTAGRLDVESGLWVYPPSLMATYYIEQYELDVRLSTSFDDESTLLAQQFGLAETVAQRYPVFNHMMRSVRFMEPISP